MNSREFSLLWYLLLAFHGGSGEDGPWNGDMCEEGVWGGEGRGGDSSFNDWWQSGFRLNQIKLVLCQRIQTGFVNSKLITY